jgi:hypothetical protein
MFDPIKGPNNQYQGPAVGLGTENGDNWHTAVAKINAGFKKIINAIEGGVAPGAPDDVALGERLSHIEDALTAMQIRLDAMTAPVNGQVAAEAAKTEPDPKPPAPEPTAAAPADPAPIAAAIPVTTASTYIGAGGPAT